MKGKFKITIIILLFSLSAYCQGCSDAGFCNLKYTREVYDFLDKKNTVILGTSYAVGMEDIRYIENNIEYDYTLDKNFSFQSKLTFSNVTGSYGTISGFGDFFLSSNYKLINKKKLNLSCLLGIKLALNNADKKNSLGNTLPMDYQTSLGTNDLIFGAGILLDKVWEFSIGAQIPVVNKNNNQFLPVNFINSKEFVQTTGFKRASDLLFKASYTFKTPKSRFAFKPALYFIDRISKDTYKDSNDINTPINGSSGLTVNGAFNVQLILNDGSQLELSAFLPLIVHEIRPDGLTRASAIGLLYRIKF